MARPILPIHQLSSIPQSAYAVVTLLFCAFALFMCASHSRKWRRWKACFGHGHYNRDPVIVQLNNEDMMLHGFHFGGIGIGEGIATSGEFSSVWKKNILMGGKCQLPDFSGVIIYDSTGNIVPPKASCK